MKEVLFKAGVYSFNGSIRYWSSTEDDSPGYIWSTRFTDGIIPYIIFSGKVIYRESDIQTLFEKYYHRS